jgi:hypothetical protein
MPIYRGRPTKNYTVIDNRALRDPRLNGEEKGLLVWLLSHHPQWKIIISVVMREMRWGRDKTYRVLGHLLRLGYVHREQERDSKSGSFGEVVYYVYADTSNNPYVPSDQPLPNFPHPESSKASKRRSKDSKETPPNPHFSANNRNQKRSTSEGATIRQRRLPITSPDGQLVSFEKFWNAYAPEPYMSKLAAQRIWRRMSETERQQAYQCVSLYLGDCKSNSRKRVSGVRYLRDKVYDGYSTKQATAGVIVRPYSPQWQAWREHLIKRGERVGFMDSRAREGYGYAVASEWPPVEAP